MHGTMSDDSHARKRNDDNGAAAVVVGDNKENHRYGYDVKNAAATRGAERGRQQRRRAAAMASGGVLGGLGALAGNDDDDGGGGDLGRNHVVRKDGARRRRARSPPPKPRTTKRALEKSAREKDNAGGCGGGGGGGKEDVDEKETQSSSSSSASSSSSSSSSVYHRPPLPKTPSAARMVVGVRNDVGSAVSPLWTPGGGPPPTPLPVPSDEKEVDVEPSVPPPPASADRDDGDDLRSPVAAASSSRSPDASSSSASSSSARVTARTSSSTTTSDSSGDSSNTSRGRGTSTSSSSSSTTTLHTTASTPRSTNQSALTGRETSSSSSSAPSSCRPRRLRLDSLREEDEENDDEKRKMAATHDENCEGTAVDSTNEEEEDDDDDESSSLLISIKGGEREEDDEDYESDNDSDEEDEDDDDVLVYDEEQSDDEEEEEGDDDGDETTLPSVVAGGESNNDDDDDGGVAEGRDEETGSAGSNGGGDVITIDDATEPAMASLSSPASSPREARATSPALSPVDAMVDSPAAEASLSASIHGDGGGGGTEDEEADEAVKEMTEEEETYDDDGSNGGRAAVEGDDNVDRPARTEAVVVEETAVTDEAACASASASAGHSAPSPTLHVGGAETEEVLQNKDDGRAVGSSPTPPIVVEVSQSTSVVQVQGLAEEEEDDGTVTDSDDDEEDDEERVENFAGESNRPGWEDPALLSPTTADESDIDDDDEDEEEEVVMEAVVLDDSFEDDERSKKEAGEAVVTTGIKESSPRRSLNQQLGRSTGTETTRGAGLVYSSSDESDSDDSGTTELDDDYQEEEKKDRNDEDLKGPSADVSVVAKSMGGLSLSGKGEKSGTIREEKSRRKNRASPVAAPAASHHAALDICKSSSAPSLTAHNASDLRSTLSTSGSLVPKTRRIRRRDVVKKGKWSLGSQIGAGSFGTVHMGMNSLTGNLMAVKTLHVPSPSCAGHHGANTLLEDIWREMDVLRSLDHPNIVRYLGSEMDDDQRLLRIFQEWVPGGSVSSLLNKFGPFPLPVVRTYLRQVLLGLAYLHDHGILHRDIKGGNILVSDEGVVKLADFGASKRIPALGTKDAAGQEKEDDMMESLTLRGTPYFIAPEVFEEKYGKKADVWSVGGVAYQMASGQPPWKGMGFTNPMSLYLHLKSNDGPPQCPIKSENAAEAGALQELIRKCFRRDPSQRPSSHALLDADFLDFPDDAISVDEGSLCTARGGRPSSPPSIKSQVDVPVVKDDWPIWAQTAANKENRGCANPFGQAS